jgi:adenosylmethionine-8-amino-7-oxononanoate aminotransferase
MKQKIHEIDGRLQEFHVELFLAVRLKGLFAVVTLKHDKNSKQFQTARLNLVTRYVLVR